MIGKVEKMVKKVELNGQGHARSVNVRSVQVPTTPSPAGERQYIFEAQNQPSPQHELT